MTERSEGTGRLSTRHGEAVTERSEVTGRLSTGHPNQSTFDVCVLGSFMKDLVVEAPRLPRSGETLRGSGFHEFLGGKGINQAVAAARLGARTAMIGRVGADVYGGEFLEVLKAEGVDASHVRQDGAIGTGVGLPVIAPGGVNSIIIVPRANDAVDAGHVADAATLIQSSRVLLVQLELPMAATVAALRLARAAGVLTVLNPAPYAELPEGMADLVDVIVPNEIEAEELTGVPCTSDRAADVARRIRREWSRLGVVVTLGSRGAIVVDEVETPHGVDWHTSWLPAYPVLPVDTVGAGDAFCGALATRLAVGDSLRDAAIYAGAAGALATTRQGAVAAMPTRRDVESCLVSLRATVDSRAPVPEVDAAETR